MITTATTTVTASIDKATATTGIPKVWTTTTTRQLQQTTMTTITTTATTSERGMGRYSLCPQLSIAAHLRM
jgi:hypothetical protein